MHRLRTAYACLAAGADTWTTGRDMSTATGWCASGQHSNQARPQLGICLGTRPPRYVLAHLSMCSFVPFLRPFNVVLYVRGLALAQHFGVHGGVGGHGQIWPGHTKMRCAWPCGHCGVHVSTVGRRLMTGRWTWPGSTGGRVVAATMTRPRSVWWQFGGA